MANSMTFNDTDLSSEPYAFLLLDVDMPLVPSQRINSKQVPYRHGVIIQGSFFDAMNFSVVGIIQGVAYDETTGEQDAISKMDALCNLFFADSEPKFLNFDNYMATKAWLCRVNGQIEIDWINPSVAQLTIPFIAPDPCPYASSETVIINQSPPFTINDSNTSNTNATPVVTLKGSTSNLTLSNAATNESISWGNTYSGWLQIDSEKQTVKSSSDNGVTWNTVMSGVSGIFPTIKPNASNAFSTEGFTGTVDVTYRARA